jgi:flagellar protein FliS
MLNPYRNQMDQDILCAEPLELVVMLYKGLHGNIRDARQQLAAGDIAGRARSVSKAMAIVGELASTLDLNLGGELAAGLHQLYSFLAARLLDGHYRQVDGPLAEAEAVTNTLLEAWTAVRTPVEKPAVIPIYGDSPYGAGQHMESPRLQQYYG